MTARFVPYLLIVIIGGCGLFEGDDRQIEIRTDGDSYNVLPETVIRLTVSNESDVPIFYICTGQIYLEELRGGEIVSRWMIHGFEDCIGPRPVDAGQKEVFDLRFDEKSAIVHVSGAAFNESVRYRMTVDLFWDQAFKKALSDLDRRSNTFQIVRNPVL